MAVGDLFAKHLSNGVLRGLPTAPSSPREDGNCDHHQSLSSITQELFNVSTKDSPPKDACQQSLPTPPRSSAASASSSTQTEVETGSDAVKVQHGHRSSSNERPSCRRHLSAGDGMIIRTRRQTAGLDPLPTVTTSPSVPASHISQSTSLRASSPNTLTSASQTLSAQSSLISHLENTKLTDDAAPPRKKNTPPHTPRALSNDGSEGARRSAATSTPRNGQSPARDGPTKSQQGSAPVSPPKGKLPV